jgi:predicted Kef-type K+ transport protein
MYSLTAIFQKEPVAIAGALRSVLYVLVLAGVVTWDAALLAGVALTAEIVLGLFVRSSSTSTAAPKLPEGTPVLNPAAPDGDTPPPDLIVVARDQVGG